MGSIGAKTNIQDAINALPYKQGSKSRVENPLYKDNDIVYFAFEELSRRAEANRKSVTTTEDIFVDRIISNQNWLNKKQLQADAELDTAPPTIKVIKYDDTYILQDGNHRVAIAKMKSVPKIRAEVIDLDKRGKK